MFPHHVQLLIEWIMLPGAMTALKIVPMNPVTLAYVRTSPLARALINTSFHRLYLLLDLAHAQRFLLPNNAAYA